ncbi:unnamed protein product, partial [Mesorhabditis belari]|uniref:C2H2-type domain-containing protein n=1 Tax=Mesorhabditis belari TaxID=2138241 RepID=A0AAF3EN58_9BILA
MPASSRGPLFVWACLPDQPDLARVYTVLAGIGCDNISFVSDLARIPLTLPREDSPINEGKEQMILNGEMLGKEMNDGQRGGGMRPASSHTVSDSSCSRSITPPSSTNDNPPHRQPSPIKSEPSDDVDVNDEVDITLASPQIDDDDSEPEKMPLNLHAIASFLSNQHAQHQAAASILRAMTPKEEIPQINAMTPQSEAGPSVDLSFLRNVPSSEGKEKSVTCQICEKSFSRNARNVSRHAATHFPRAAARYTCGKCGEAFGRNDRAKYHVDTKHAGRADLHDKAKDSEYSEEWVKAVKQCFPGFDFSPRDTHARTPSSVADAEMVAVSLVSTTNGVVGALRGMSTPKGNSGEVHCTLCSWTLFQSSPTSQAVEHAVSHCPPQYTCSQCGEQAEKKAALESHISSRHHGNAQLIDSSTKGEPQLRELALMCFPSRANDMDKAFEERAKTVSKKRRIDSLIESKKKVMKAG